MAVPESTWLDAGPFRAHVRHLMAVGELPVAAVAVLAGVPERVLHQLLGPAGGRTAGRINRVHASALFAVTADAVQRLRNRQVPVAATWGHLRRLRAAGWSDEDLALAVGLTLPGLRSLLRLGIRRCSALTALKATALASAQPLSGGTTLRRAA